MTAVRPAAHAPGTAYAYAPGDWTVLARSRMLAAVPSGTDEATVRALWEAMGDDAGIAPLLPLVSGGHGAGDGATSPFAVVTTTRGLHAVLRGPVRLTVTGTTGSSTYTGERETPWTEHHLDEGGFSSFTLHCAPVAARAPSLPLTAGAVLAASITAHATSDDLKDTEAPGTAPAVAISRAGAPAEPADLTAAEPGSLGAMDPELEAEPSSAVGEAPGREVFPGAAGPAEGGASAPENPGLSVTSVPADVADPGVASAMEPLPGVAPIPAPGTRAGSPSGEDARGR